MMMLVLHYLNMVQFEGLPEILTSNILLVCYVNLIYRNLVNCQLQEQVHNLYSTLFSLTLFCFYLIQFFFFFFCNWFMVFKGDILIFAFTTNSAKGVYHHSYQSQAQMKEEGLLSSNKIYLVVPFFKYLWQIDKWLLFSANVFLATFPIM